jgi:16S rRNA processing protein RimM
MHSADSIKLTPVAQIVKTYDSTGEVLIRINAPEFEERLANIKEPVFIHFEELPVPFFITSAVQRSGNAWIIKFSTVRDGAHAQELVGNDIFIEDFSPASEDSMPVSNSSTSESVTQDGQISDIEQLIGFKLLDEDGAEKGIITSFYEFTANICLEINNSTMVPLHDDLIIFISKRDKTLTMKIPKGLF